MAKNAKEEALKILDKNMIGTMATVQHNKPHSRYMTFFNEEFTSTATSKKTHKAEELQQNPNTHILLGYDGHGLGDSFLEIEGTVIESDDEAMKKKCGTKLLKAGSKAQRISGPFNLKSYTYPNAINEYKRRRTSSYRTLMFLFIFTETFLMLKKVSFYAI